MIARTPAAVAVVALGLALGAPACAQDADMTRQIPGERPVPTAPIREIVPAAAPAPVALPATPPGFRVVLKDDFDGAALDRKWTTLAGTWRGQNGQLLSSLPVLLRPLQPLYTPIASTAERPLGLSPAPVAHVAAIASTTPIGNAFRVALVIAGRGVAPAAIDFGPYLGDDAGSGYRLVYDGEYGHPLKLKATQGGRVETVAKADIGADLYDGNRHLVVWTRDASGRMTVAIDGEAALAASDNSIGGSFAGLSIVNTGGSWGIYSLTVAQPDG
jgi:hypothetical protein